MLQRTPHPAPAPGSSGPKSCDLSHRYESPQFECAHSETVNQRNHKTSSHKPHMISQLVVPFSATRAWLFAVVWLYNRGCSAHQTPRPAPARYTPSPPTDAAVREQQYGTNGQGRGTHSRCRTCGCIGVELGNRPRHLRAEPDSYPRRRPKRTASTQDTCSASGRATAENPNNPRQPARPTAARRPPSSVGAGVSP